jgi:hypothetical protein
MPLYRNPDGTIARCSDGRLMRAPTQAIFELCCCDDDPDEDDWWPGWPDIIDPNNPPDHGDGEPVPQGDESPDPCPFYGMTDEQVGIWANVTAFVPGGSTEFALRTSPVNHYRYEWQSATMICPRTGGGSGCEWYSTGTLATDAEMKRYHMTDPPGGSGEWRGPYTDVGRHIQIYLTNQRFIWGGGPHPDGKYAWFMGIQDREGNYPHFMLRKTSDSTPGGTYSPITWHYDYSPYYFPDGEEDRWPGAISVIPGALP